MDTNSDAAQVLGSERVSKANSILTFGKWEVVLLEFTPEKLDWLWNEMNRYRTLFSDLTRGDQTNFYNVVALPDSLWLEVKEESQTVGVIYWTEMFQLIDCNIHIMFFDRKLEEKIELCEEIGRWFFKEYPQFGRVSALLPDIYYATIRLARHVGFKFEGKKRKSQLIGGKYVNEIMLGLLYEELK